MIKFFRHIRKNLLMENKTSKYFKYAIGEIVLVVIGILIALQINTWNEQKRNENTLKQILVEFKEELRLNIKDLKIGIKAKESQREIKDKLLKNKRLDTIPIDTLEKHMETYHLSAGYSPTLLKRFENSQITNYGKYDSIFINLQELYGFLWPDFEKSKNNHNDAVDKQDEFWLYQQNTYELKFTNDKTTFIKDSIYRKKELIKLIKSPIVRNILKSDYRKKKVFIKKMEQIKGFSEKIQKQINETLKD